MQFEFFLKNFQKSQVKSFMKLITHLKNLERDLISTVRIQPLHFVLCLYPVLMNNIVKITIKKRAFQGCRSRSRFFGPDPTPTLW